MQNTDTQILTRIKKAMGGMPFFAPRWFTVACPVRDKILVEMRIPRTQSPVRDEIYKENILSLTGQGGRVVDFSTNIMSLTGQNQPLVLHAGAACDPKTMMYKKIINKGNYA